MTTKAGQALISYADAMDDRLHADFRIPKSMRLIIEESVAAIEREVRDAVDERERAVALANRVLDDASRDPDSDLLILARQFLRAIQTDLFLDPESARPEDAEALTTLRTVRDFYDAGLRASGRDEG